MGMELRLIENAKESLQVTVTYPVMNQHVEQLIKRIKSMDIKIIGELEGKNTCVAIEEIYYIESLERKTFIYTQNQVFKTSKKLYILLEELGPFGFLQVSKSCLININVLDHVRTLFNSRLEATLTNGEKIIIARTYIPAVKQWLQGEVKAYERKEDVY